MRIGALTPGTDNVADIGSTSKELRNVYLGSNIHTEPMSGTSKFAIDNLGSGFYYDFTTDGQVETPWGANAPVCYFMAYENFTGIGAAFFICDSAATYLIHQTGTGYTITKDTAGKLNVYVEGGAIKFQRKGANRYFVKILSLCRPG